MHGAGAGGVGIAEQLKTALIEKGMRKTRAVERIFTLDSQGLVTTERELEPYKKKFAKDPAKLGWYKDSRDGELLNVVKKAGVTILIGTSGQGGCFTKEVIYAMAGNSNRPVILPLSNPTGKTEALPQDIYAWTEGKALVATGSPFAPVSFLNKKHPVSQCNNVFVFPGVGLGVIASGAKEVLPSFFTAAARAVSDHVSPGAMANGELLPPVEKLSKVSLNVAQAVGETAIREDIDSLCAFSKFQHHNDPERLRELIRRMRWRPEYLPVISQTELP